MLKIMVFDNDKKKAPPSESVYFSAVLIYLLKLLGCQCENWKRQLIDTFFFCKSDQNALEKMFSHGHTVYLSGSDHVLKHFGSAMKTRRAQKIKSFLAGLIKTRRNASFSCAKLKAPQNKHVHF